MWLLVRHEMLSVLSILLRQSAFPGMLYCCRFWSALYIFISVLISLSMSFILVFIYHGYPVWLGVGPLSLVVAVGRESFKGLSYATFLGLVAGLCCGAACPPALALCPLPWLHLHGLRSLTGGCLPAAGHCSGLGDWVALRTCAVTTGCRVMRGLGLSLSPLSVPVAKVTSLVCACSLPDL